MKYYENPDCLPLEELQLIIKDDGVIVAVSALNEKWTDKRYLLHYEEPEIYNDDGSEIMGTKEHWMEIVNYIIEDLNWLLGLPFYRFWSNIVYNTSIINTLVSFLQEAPPFYALENFPNKPEMLEALEKLRHTVLIIFARLITNKESSTEYMNRPFLGNLLYEKYIFTIPIIFDLCQLYGRENIKVVEKIMYSVFTLQPMYNDDLQKSVPCLIQAMQNVEQRFEDCPSDATEAVALSERSGFVELTLHNLEDLILYILDISSTLTILFKCYPPITTIFHRDDFINKIVSLYGSIIPKMYKKLDELAYNDESMPKYIELKHRLDVTRVEMLSLYRIIIYEPILNIQEKMNTITDDEIRNCVDEYLDLLINAISEKEFIMDYHQFYPINIDLETASKLYPEVDTIKCKYILQSLYATIGADWIPANTSLDNTDVAIAGPSGIQNNQQDEHCNDVNCINKTQSTLEDPEKLMSLILEVKDVLCDCSEYFIQLCLDYYNYDVVSVVNAVLENNLPPSLKELDKTLPYISPDIQSDSMEALTTGDLATGIERLNIYDNDEFNITEDVTSTVYMGKKKDKYRDANEMLNDKSEINKSRSIYEKYSIVDEYDDEYDDTYDSHNVRGSVMDDSTEIDARSFTIPKILRVRNKSSSEDDIENEDEKPIQNNDHFIQNPAELRAKAEQRKQEKAREGKNAHVVGKPKDQGQNKDIANNKHKKNVYKTTHSNHNRRVGSQIKRRQGMVPS